MLKELKVRNYALIQRLDIELNKGLSIITGETGAGKSIILGALGLLMGKRADTKVLYDAAEKCVVEGVFEISGYGLEGVFEENDWDYEELCQIRREINPAGKSRAFVNDTPVNLEQLSELSSYLIDIHSQHDNLILVSEPYQIKLLDSYLGNTSLYSEYQLVYNDYQKLKREWEERIRSLGERTKEREYDQYVFQELEQAGLKEGEYSRLEKELKEIDNAEEIKEKLMAAQGILEGDENSLVPKLAVLTGLSEKLAGLSQDYQVVKGRLRSVYLELKDIALEVGRLADPDRIETGNIGEKRERFDLLNRLMLKHKCKAFEDLLELRSALSKKLGGFQSMEEELNQLEKRTQEAKVKAEKLASELSSRRERGAKELEQELKNLLSELSMPESQLFWKLERNKEIGKHGWETIRLLFSSNVGFEPKEIKSIASGGEFSRLMLSLKHILAQKSKMPTLIFDEIDTGISGEVAFKMAKMIRGMASDHQMIAITHLPQIAASGNQHYFVYKNIMNGKTVSLLKELSLEERLKEIATMMSGSHISDSALASANELIQSFQNQ